jgi:glycosyltransferase involved in cell wall biosynthesis
MPPDAVSSPAAAPASLSLLHRAWRLLPARQRRAWLAYGAARLAPRAGPRPGRCGAGLVIGGEVTQASGLGEGARLLHAGLAARGVASWLIDAGIPVPGDHRDAAPPRDTLATVPPAAPLLLCVNGPQLPAALLRLPRARLRGRLIIGYWSWELAVLPPTWRAAIGCVHEIWTPSAFIADAVAPILPPDGGIRLRVVPYPMTPAAPGPADRAAFGLPEGAVVVLASLNLASSFMRKNPLGAIAAFRAAFGDRPDRILVLKIGKTGHYAADLAAIRAAAAGAANIRIETSTLPSADRHALTACADIVLSLHRSEGFGLVPAEAMLLGKPVVATGWSGNLAFMDAGSAALVGFRLVKVDDPRGVYDLPGATWAEPDIAEAAAHLVRLADDPAARTALGARGQAHARAMLRGDALAEAVADLGLSPSRVATG